MAQVKILGNTYPVKDKLKALGAKWNQDDKCWTITDKKLAEANKIVAAAPPREPLTPGKCHDCGRACKQPFTQCWDCKKKHDQRAGICAKCREPLEEWDRQHGMRLCAGCRDGGGNAHGGQSYYDRHGNFVLGDDD